MAESSSSGLNRALEAIEKCDRQANYREWSDNIPQESSPCAPELLTVLEATCPADTRLITYAVDTWRTANKRLGSVLYFATTGSAHITVKTHKGNVNRFPGRWGGSMKGPARPPQGQHKEARRALREHLHKNIKIGEDPTDFIATMDNLRFSLKDIGKEISDESYTYLLLGALTPKY